MSEDVKEKERGSDIGGPSGMYKLRGWGSACSE